jgi:hypothetical protein
VVNARLAPGIFFSADATDCDHLERSPRSNFMLTDMNEDNSHERAMLLIHSIKFCARHTTELKIHN